MLLNHTTGLIKRRTYVNVITIENTSAAILSPKNKQFILISI
jgi:hypothetical protein